MKRFAGLFAAVLVTVSASAQVPQTTPIPFARPQGAAAPPAVITLLDALDKAKELDAAVQSAMADAAIAREDRLQAKSSLRPSINSTSQYLGTQGNGVNPTGRFVASDGVHVYRSVATVQQVLSAETFFKSDYQRAGAAQALAEARVEIARRGVAATVADRYYALVISQRRYGTAQQAIQQAQRFFDITQQLERAGEAARSDVVKAEIQLQQKRRQSLDETVAMEIGRLNLAVLISRTIDENFTVVDDLDSAKSLPSFAELRTMAERENPSLKAATAAINQASFDIRKARSERLPSLTLEANYGLEANAFKLHSTVAAEPHLGPLPNLGYLLNFTLSVPVFNWGATGSRIRQAEMRRQQADAELSQAQRQLLGGLYQYYNEAVGARSLVDLARSSADLASESLRLITLRYQAGESGVLEVVDAQNTLIEARNAYDDAQVRFRLAVSALESVTGGF